jgi:hypothetical protein
MKVNTATLRSLGDALAAQYVERFLSGIREVTADGCWLWGPTNPRKSHHQVQYARRRMGAHVFSYWLFVGALAPGQQVNHTCRHAHCVQPGHLYAGSHAQNMRDRWDDAGYYGVSGERHHNARVSDANVVAMREAYRRGGVSFKTLGERYGITWTQAWNIVRGTQRRDLPGAVPVRPPS